MELTVEDLVRIQLPDGGTADRGRCWPRCHEWQSALAIARRSPLGLLPKRRRQVRLVRARLVSTGHLVVRCTPGSVNQS